MTKTSGLPAKKETRPPWKRWLILTAGYVFVVLGILGFALPFLQGFLFLFIGLALLSKEAVWAQRLRKWLAKKFPRANDAAEKAEHRASQWMQRTMRRFRRK